MKKRGGKSTPSLFKWGTPAAGGVAAVASFASHSASLSALIGVLAFPLGTPVHLVPVS